MKYNTKEAKEFIKENKLTGTNPTGWLLDFAKFLDSQEQKEPVKFDIVKVYKNGLEVWLYPHPNPIHLGVIDKMLYVNGKAIVKQEQPTFHYGECIKGCPQCQPLKEKEYVDECNKCGYKHCDNYECDKTVCPKCKKGMLWFLSYPSKPLKEKECGCNEELRTWCEKHYFEMYGVKDSPKRCSLHKNLGGGNWECSDKSDNCDWTDSPSIPEDIEETDQAVWAINQILAYLRSKEQK